MCPLHTSRHKQLRLAMHTKYNYVHSPKIMNPSWVAPCYVYRSQKFSPGLKILLAAASGGIFCASFAISQRSRVPDSYQNCVPTPNPATSTTAKHSNKLLWRLGSVYTCISSILSFMQSLGVLSVVNKVFDRDQLHSNQTNPHKWPCPSCKSSLIATEVTFALLQINKRYKQLHVLYLEQTRGLSPTGKDYNNHNTTQVCKYWVM